jgi:hypothetical protein
MRYVPVLPLLAVPLVLFGPLSAPPGLQQEQPTHVLEMTVSGSDEPARIDVLLHTDDGTTWLTIGLPDGSRFTTECFLTEQGDLKFQMSRIANGGLVNVQFIGLERTDGSHEGSFTGMVEGELRPDMSGTFVLSPKVSP